MARATRLPCSPTSRSPVGIRSPPPTSSGRSIACATCSRTRSSWSRRSPAVEAPDPQTVVITLDTPYPGILPILASPSLGILDSVLVSENGGTDAADAAETDTAEEYLNSQSAGSGPYMLTSYLPDQEVVLERNPNYWREPGCIRPHRDSQHHRGRHTETADRGRRHRHRHGTESGPGPHHAGVRRESRSIRARRRPPSTC